MANIINPEDWMEGLQGADSVQPTPEEVNDFRVDQTAKGLAGRSQSRSQEISEDHIDLELKLQQVQQELSQATDSITQMKLNAEAEAIAEQLVSGNTTEVEAEQVDAARDLINEHGQETVERDLQWAADNLDEGVSEALNEAFQENGEDAYKAYATIQQLRRDGVTRHEGDVVVFDQSISNELQEQYGDQGVALASINAALASGKASRADAVKLVMSDPQLMQAALSASKSGLINLAY